MLYPSIRRTGMVMLISLASSTAPARQLEEVIVTAQKRAQSLQDVPISVSAVQGDKLQDAGIPNMAALADYVPNLHISSVAVNTEIYMRGVGSGNNQGFEQSVGMYIDGVYMGRGRQYRAGFLDLERIEVLRGPQGTLFGRNTVAGAINVITASSRPGDELSGDVAVSLESHDGALVEGQLGGSLTDNLAARLAFKYRETDGYVDNAFLNDSEGQLEEQGGRLTLVWAPTDQLELNFKYSRMEFDRVGAPAATKLYLDPVSRDQLFPNATPFAAAAYYLTDTFYPEVVEQSTRDFVTYKDNGFGQSQADGIGIGRNPDSSDEEYDNAVLQLDYDFERVRLTSITGYSAYRYIDGVDADWLPLQFVHRDDDQEFEQFSQEIRFTSPGDEFFDYVAGLYYERSDLEFDRLVSLDTSFDGLFESVPVNFFLPGFPDEVSVGDFGFSSLAQLIAFSEGGSYAGEIPGRRHFYELESESWAAFGQVTFNFSETWQLNLGLRYTEETKDVRSTQFLVDELGNQDEPNFDYWLGFIQAQFFNNYAYDYDEDRETDRWLPSANLQWYATPDSMFYLSLSQGFKSGGFTAADDGEPGGLELGSWPCIEGEPVQDCYDPTLPNEDFEFDDEEVDALEIGGKHTLLNGGMTLNWAAFYTRYDNLQTAIFNGLSFTVKNAAESEVKGVEVDLLWQATDNLRVGANAAYLDATYRDFANGPCTAIQVDVDAFCGSPQGFTSNDLSGEPTLYASDYSAALFFDYARLFGDGLEFFAGLDINYRDEFNSSGDNDPIDVLDAFTKVNLRGGIRGDWWEVMLYGRNVFDEEVLMQGFDTPAVAGSHSNFIDEGRIWGGRIKARF
ncbi:MAG: TonB-dependent receptor [Pseudomonadota bacterium]